MSDGHRRGRLRPAKGHASLSALTPDASARLEGPDWLRARRARAAEAFAAAGLPSTSEEVWRYSRIDDLDLASFVPATGPAGPPDVLPAPAQALLDAVDEVAAVVVARNGRVVRDEVRDELRTKGVRAWIAGDVDRQRLGSGYEEPPDQFATLNDAFTVEPVVVHVPEGVVVGAPVVVVHVTEGEGVAAFPRLVVDAGADSEVAVLEIQV